MQVENEEVVDEEVTGERKRQQLVEELMAPPGGLFISAVGYGLSVLSSKSSATVYLPLLPSLVLLGSRPPG